MTIQADFVKYIVEAIESDGNLYRQQYRPQVLYLAKKKAKGTYEREKAIKLVVYLAESGIKKFKKEFAEYFEVSPFLFSRVSMATKQAIAKRLLQDMMPEVDYEVRELKKLAAGKKPRRR